MLAFYWWPLVVGALLWVAAVVGGWAIWRLMVGPDWKWPE